MKTGRCPRFSFPMSLRSLYPLATLAVILLAGCTAKPAASPGAPAALPSTGDAAAPVVPPVSTTPAKTEALPATIKGSEESSTLLDNFTAFIVAVDGQPVAAGRKGWSQPVNLPPGSRRLMVEFNRGVFLARTELTLDAKPGVAYELRHASDAQVYGDHTFCEFWIVDLATGEKATPALRTGLNSVKPGG